MATIATSNLTLADIAKTQLPDGSIEQNVVQQLAQLNEINLDATWEEANGGTFHRSVIQTGYPEPTWRRFYEGVQPTKTSEAQVDEPIGMMENRSVVDADVLDMSPNPARTRFIQAQGILQGFSTSFCQTLMYGDVGTSPAKFNGILPRFDLLSAASGENIVDAGGVGSDNATIAFVNWSPQTVFCIYPRGVPAGVTRVDNGKQEILDSNTPPRRFTAYEEIFKQKCGLVVANWQHISVIRNIDKSALVAQSGAAALLELMAVAIEKIPASGGGRMAIYMNRTLKTMLRIQCMKQSNVYLTVGQEEGRPKLMFDGVPIRRVDQMAADEARVV
ncbi:MAG: hypothetical protein Q7R45_07305 [Sulfuricaulis sp.]|nr:hypothetical protein [Sulfuricaulis sp.]